MVEPLWRIVQANSLKKKKIACGVKKKKNVIFAMTFIKLKIFLFIHEIWP